MSREGRVVSRGGRKRQFKTKRSFRAYCKEQAKQGRINRADGGWRSSSGSSMDVMCIRGSVG